jgi:ABC-type amino acid transport system permease subunit
LLIYQWNGSGYISGREYLAGILNGVNGAIIGIFYAIILGIFAGLKAFFGV